MNYETDDHRFAPGVVEAVVARPWPVVAAAVGGLVVALAVTQLVLPERYSASATATITDPKQAAFTTGGAITADYERFLSSTVGFAESGQVMDAAADTLGDLAGDELSDQVAVTSDIAARTLTVTVNADSPSAAADRANTVIEAFDSEHADHLREQTGQTLAALDEQIEAAREDVDDARSLDVASGDASPATADEAAALLTTLQARRVELTVNATAYGSGVEFIEVADAPSAPASPSRTINAAVGLLLGVLAGMAFVWFRADRQRLLSSSDGPQALIDIPLLGKVPEFPAGAGPLTDPTEMPAEEYQFVASALNVALADDRRVVMVGGVGRGVGTTVTVANLAAAAAGDDLTVAVVDACTDEGLGALFGQKPMQAGLLDLLSMRDDAIDRQRLTWALGPVSVGARSVRLLSLGTTSRSTAISQLRSGTAQNLFDELRSRFDLVVVDCGSVLDTATAGALARSADAMALVIRKDSPSDPVIEARERLAVDGMPLVGYVFSRADRSERRRFRAANLDTTRPSSAFSGPATPELRPSFPSAALPQSSERTSDAVDPEPSSPTAHLHASVAGMNGMRAWPMPKADSSVASGADGQG